MEKLETKGQANQTSEWPESEIRAIRHLAAARFCIPEELPSEKADAAWAQVEHHLHLKEVRNALDCAMKLGNEIGAGKGFWRELLLATRDMELDAHASQLAQYIRLKESN